jgi:hypothetical protein
MKFIDSISMNVKTFFLIVLLLLLLMPIDSIPWWSFVIPVSALGAIIGIRKWKVSTFFVGFLSGLSVWLGGNVVFHFYYGGILLRKMSGEYVVVGLLIAGILGGLVTGLALYTGKMLTSDQSGNRSR